MGEKNKILIIGGAGKIGKYIVEASANAGHSTFALGDLNKHESLVNAIKQVDVVISTVGNMHLADQTKIISAIKEAGHIKRFLPSEFGNDVDHVHAVEPAKSVYGTKAQIRRAFEAEGIPYTYVPSGIFGSFIIPIQFMSVSEGKVNVIRDGNVKAIFNDEKDMATYTVRSVDDPRTLNKTLLIKPPKNIFTFNEIVALKEKKLGKSLQKIYVSEEKLLKDIPEMSAPYNLGLAINHSVFIKGDQTNFEIDPSKEVEASVLYPDVNDTGVEKLL